MADNDLKDKTSGGPWGLNRPGVRVDMHVHSRFSHRPSSWVLKKIGCAESYTEPRDLYRRLKARGMTGVTITDHNTIDGCLEIAHYPDTFISEEVTAYFPENCKIHVLVYDISEAQHREIARLRKNIYDLVEYLDREEILHAVAHPLFSVNGRLRPDHLDRLLLLFKIFELNGARDALQNAIVARIVRGLTETEIGRLAGRYQLSPRGEKPWKKHLISGSDDHSSLYMGLSYTESRQAVSLPGFLDEVRRGGVAVKTQESTPEILAHNLYSIIYQFYNRRFALHRWIDDPVLSAFLGDALLPGDHRRDGTKTTKLPDDGDDIPGLDDDSLSDRFLNNARVVLDSDSGLLSGGHADEGPGLDMAHNWRRFVNRFSETIARQFADELLGRINQADILSLFSMASSSATLYMMLSPYFIAYSLFSRDRRLGLEYLRERGGDPAEFGRAPRRVAMFSDTFNQINGVAKAIQCLVEGARRTGKSLTLITCDPDPEKSSGVKAFTPVGEYDLPEYPELKMYYPPFLEILSYCYHEGFTHIHAETPGVMGLTALAVANLLGLPFRGTYHTALPQTVKALTGDAKIEDWFWKYVRWFYGRMDRVYVPSAVTARELVDRGLAAEKIVVQQWGVDGRHFHPARRNGFFSDRYHIQEDTIKLLYVGRVSPEKNLGVLEGVLRRIVRTRKDVCLVVVGEGPGLADLRQSLRGLPVVFTGYLSGESLAGAYASSDIFVFPSTVDTMGNVIVEAQASGLPVIVTDRGGPRENMIDGKTGLVVAADGRLAERLATAILRLCAEPGLRKAMGKNARAYAGQRSIEKSFLSFWEGASKAGCGRTAPLARTAATMPATA